MKLNRLFFYFLLCTLSAPEAYANGKTINDLVQACDEGATAVEFGFCTGYILAAVESAENYSIVNNTNLLCLPEEWTVGQGMKIFLKWASENPERLHEQALAGVVASNYQAFKCK